MRTGFTAGLLFVLSSFAFAQDVAPDATQDLAPVPGPLQLSVAPTTYGFNIAFATPSFGVNAAGMRFVIEFVSARCQFSNFTSDVAGEMILITQDAKGKSHPYNLRVHQTTTPTPGFESNLSYVSEPIRTYHDGGVNGTAPLQILFRFSATGLRAPAVCQAEVSGYTVAKQVTP